MEAPSVAPGRGEGSGWLDLDWPVPRARNVASGRCVAPCRARLDLVRLLRARFEGFCTLKSVHTGLGKAHDPPADPQF